MSRLFLENIEKLFAPSPGSTVKKDLEGLDFANAVDRKAKTGLRHDDLTV
jgi:hypothetical protein